MDRHALPLNQVHPAVLGTDITASVVSWVLLWRQKRAVGLLVRLVPPVIVAALVLRSNPPATPGGEPGSVVKPSPALGIRAAGDVLTAWGSWRRRPLMVLLGMAVIAFGWSFGLGHRAPVRPFN